MKVELRPELEALIQQDVERGTYQSIDEYVEHAVSLLHEQEAWLAKNRNEVAAKIEEGYDAAQRGELLDADPLRAKLDERKRAWFAKKRQA